MAERDKRIREAVLAMDAGVTHGWILEQRLIWFLIGAKRKAKKDEILKRFEEPDMLPDLIKSLVGIGVIEEEKGVITLVEDEGWRMDYF